MDAVVFSPSDDLRQRLRELFTDLADTPDKAAHVERLIDTLSLVTSTNPKITPAQPHTFRHIGRRRSDDEIRRVHDRLRRAMDEVKNLSATSIERLAEQGGLRGFLTIEMERFMAAATIALETQEPQPLPDIGRPTDQRSLFIASAILNAVVTLTKYDPRQPTQKQDRKTGWTPLLREVFNILDLPGNPRAMADAAERNWIDLHKTPPHGEGLNTPQHETLPAV